MLERIRNTETSKSVVCLVTPVGNQNDRNQAFSRYASQLFELLKVSNQICTI